MKATPSIPAAFRGGEAADGACVFDRVSGEHTTDARTARDVVFYRLGRKFVDNERSIPEDVRSVLYYTLAIGHHTGVIDCLEPRVSTSREVYGEVLALLGEGEAADKLAGVERFGEIQVDKEHVGMLRAAACDVLSRAGVDGFAAASANAEAAAGDRADVTASDATARDGRERERACVQAIDALLWLEEFVALLDEVAREPQVYAMGRRVTP